MHSRRLKRRPKIPGQNSIGTGGQISIGADKLDVKVVWLGVRPMHSKWASCSTAGHLNFSDELLQLNSELWDYVIVHELLHFFVPNHGKLWKSLMRAHLGAYETHEHELKRIAHDT